MICLSFFKVVVATPLNVERSIPSQGMPQISIPHAGVNMVSVMSTSASILSYNTLPARYPNQSFDSAVDLNTIVGDIMLKVRRCPPETPEILEDQEAFMALSTKVILDLLENEPDTYTIDDVKVRFR
jgi:hypothetical protein